MICPKCDSENTKVYSTKKHSDETIRYIICKDCQYRFRTVERLQSGWICVERYNSLVKEVSRIYREYGVS